MERIDRSAFIIGRKFYMLVIGRKPGQYIRIGDHITVKVIKSEDGDLRLAIDAPRETNIVRGEVNQTEERDFCTEPKIQPLKA